MQPILIDVSTIKNQWSYEPPEGFTNIYIHECFNPETLETSPYVGSTDTSMKNRAGLYFCNYHNAVGIKTPPKFERYLNQFGCMHIKSKLLYVVDNEHRGEFEQKAIEEYNAINLGYNTYNAIKEVKTTSTKKFRNSANEKNKPTIQGEEDVSLTFAHRNGLPNDVATMNAGLYEAKYINRVLNLDHPGLTGSVTVKNYSGMHTTPLQELSKDLGIALKFGPAGRHTITLDNIYIIGTKTSLRTYLVEHPELIYRVAYLTMGELTAE